MLLFGIEGLGADLVELAPDGAGKDVGSLSNLNKPLSILLLYRLAPGKSLMISSSRFFVLFPVGFMINGFYVIGTDFFYCSLGYAGFYYLLSTLSTFSTIFY
jgi:hypothetical protein